MIFTDKTHDYDSTLDVWEKLYDIIYKDIFDYLFDFENKGDKETAKKCKRWYIKIDGDKQPELAKKFPKFKMAGDCIFNFNDKKVELFRKIIGDTQKGLLDKCRSNHHSLLNFSFMPITGGLNNAKGNIKCENGFERESFDRPDVLIAELQKYYQKIPSRIFARCTQNNKEALEWYLDIFSNRDIDRAIDEYCKDIYMIDDKEMFQRLINLAERPICNPETAVEYMTLACDYWDMKKCKLKKFGIDEF